jgi:transcriptional regulator with XRE-family HTH domain
MQGEELKALRVQTGMSRKKLEEELGLTVGYVGRMERGTSPSRNAPRLPPDASLSTSTMTDADPRQRLSEPTHGSAWRGGDFMARPYFGKQPIETIEANLLRMRKEKRSWACSTAVICRAQADSLPRLR